MQAASPAPVTTQRQVGQALRDTRHRRGAKGIRCPFFAQRLAALIVRSGLKRKHIAEQLLVDPSLISAWTQGEVEPKLHHLVSLARILKTTPHFLLGWKRKV